MNCRINIVSYGDAATLESHLNKWKQLNELASSAALQLEFDYLVKAGMAELQLRIPQKIVN